ncbi:MAG: presqualene diphosphate synthase HpnD [Thermoleophilaceae bacterium]|nr:presqualene diphosphate synthase HpnD [Thermoleophilaceae bacterium]
MDERAAYRHCEEITRREAENFYYGIRLLPSDKRRAMYAVYAFARRVDDIGDGSLADAEKLRLLAAEREALARLGPGSADPVIAALGWAAGRFPFPREAFGDLIDGVEMDVRGTRYESFDELVVYCRRVAGSIGRLSLAIFGASDLERAMPLADDLGVAMQITNILRDLREDRARGRVYLPAEDLRRFGVSEPGNGGDPLASARLVRFEAARAREWFDRGLALLPLLDMRSASCVSAMAGIYRRILDRIEERPAEAMRGRISLPVWEKAWVAAGSMTGSALSSGARALGHGARA